MRKKVIGILVVLLLVVFFSLGVCAKVKENQTHSPGLITYKVTIQIGSKQFDINNAGYMMEASPYIGNNRTMVPIGFIDTVFDYPKVISQDKKEITFKVKNMKIVIKIGSKDVLLKYENNTEYKVTLDAPAEIKDEIIFLPIRFISEKTGLRVSWYEKERKVIIDNKEEI